MCKLKYSWNLSNLLFCSNFWIPDDRADDIEKRVIKIKAEYLERMKTALDNVRREYKNEYMTFLNSMNKETDEVDVTSFK